MAADIAVGVLGPLTVPGAQLPLARQQRVVLAALAVAAPGGVSPERLVTGVWGDDRPADARKALQVLVARLRKTLAPASVDIRLGPDGYRLVVDPGRIDAVVFAEACARERSLAPADLTVRRRLLEEALVLVRGEPLADLPGEELLEDAVVALVVRRDAAVARLHDVRLQMGEGDELVAELTTWAAGRPLDEGSWCRLALGLHQAGRPTEALRVLDEHRRTVRETAGIEPTPAVAELEAHLLDPEGGRRPVPPRPGNLVAVPRSLLGRQREVDELGDLFGPGRVVTLVGPAGIGKTSLALHTVDVVRDRYRDGAWVCELADISHGDAVVDAVADALGVRRQRGTTLLASLASAFRGADAIVLVDNCEHVLGSVAELVPFLQRECAGLVIVATSREPIGLGAERLYRVGPLAVEGGDGSGTTGRGPAVELFLQRARDGGATLDDDGATLATVTEICRDLDGLPLAIQLAAGRARSMSITDLRRRLGERFSLLSRSGSDGPPRHRTLWDAVDWSYQLLDVAARDLFARLSVFMGGFTIEAAAAVSGLPPSSIGPLVWQLADRSMLDVVAGGETTRYQMLETLRQYGSEVLIRSGTESDARDAHTRHFARFAQEAGQAVRGADEALCVRRVSEDLANLRAAHQNAVAGGLAGEAAVLVTSLHEYAMWRQFFELGEWARATLDLDLGDSPALPALHAIAGWARCIAGDYEQAVEHARCGLAAEPAAATECGWLHDVLAHCAYFQGDVEAGLAHSADEIGRARASGDRYRLSYVLADSGIHAMLSGGGHGGVEIGRGRADEALALARGLGNPALVSIAQMAQGFAHQSTDPALAIDWFRRGAGLADHVDSRWTAGICRGELALLLSLHGDPVEALGLALQQVTAFRRAGDGSRVRSFIQIALPAVVELLAEERWAEIVVLHAALSSRPVIREPFVEAAVEEVLARIAATLGPDAMARSVAIGRGLDDATLFDMATTTMEELLTPASTSVG